MATVTSVTKHFPVPKEGFITTTASSISSGAATVPLNSVTGYTNGDTVVLIIDPGDATKKQAFTGVIDTAGVQITGVNWTEGTNTTHAAGATVVDYVAATHLAIITKGLLRDHGSTGYHKTLNDDNGNEWLERGQTASAVNQVKVTNAIINKNPKVSASGDDTNVWLDVDGKGTGGAHARNPEILFDFVASGGVWSGDAYASTLNASMTAIVCYINGRRISIAAVTARAFTASKDTYIDILDNQDGTGTLVYTETANNAASAALAANSLRIGIIVTGGTNIAAVGSVNQGDPTRVLPIASSIPYVTTDSLGNLICPRDASRATLAYTEKSTGQSAIAAITDVTGMSLTVKIPANIFTVMLEANATISDTTAGVTFLLSITDGSNVSQVERTQIITSSNAAALQSLHLQRRIPVTPGSTYTFKLRASSGAGVVNNGNATAKSSTLTVSRR